MSKRWSLLPGIVLAFVLLPTFVSGEMRPSGLGEFSTIASPMDVAVNSAGDVYVAEYGTVRKYSPSGELIWASGLGLNVSRLSVRGDSLVYVKMTGGLTGTVRLSPETGTPLETLNLGGHNVCVGERSLYISKTSSVVRYSLTGDSELKWGAAGSGSGFFASGPNDVAESAAGTILTTDNNAEGGRLQEFSTDGVFIREVSIPSTTPDPAVPWGIAADPTTGWVFVTDLALHRVYVFDRNLNYIDYIGGQPSSLPGCFLEPNAVAVSQTGVVYVSEYGNNRIQYFSLSALAVGVKNITWGKLKATYGGTTE